MMSISDKLLVVWVLLIFIVIQAFYQAERFGANKPSGSWYHFWQAVLYGCAMTIIIPFWIYFGWIVGVKLILIGLLERLAIFDPLLNWLRDKRPILTYNGKGTTQSWQDRLENLLPAKFILPLKISYILAFIVAVIFVK